MSRKNKGSAVVNVKLIPGFLGDKNLYPGSKSTGVFILS